MKLLIISDIHANWPALRAVVDAEQGVDQILCLGDLVGYGPQPFRCVQWVIEHIPVTRLIQGNHDWAVGWNEDPHCSPPYRHLARVTQMHCLRVLTEGIRSFLTELWPQRSFMIGGSKWVACHAVPSDTRFRYLALADEMDEWKTEIEIVHRPDFLFIGHTHIPGKLQIGKTMVVNPGSVGQPKDGDPRAAYAVWEDGAVSLRRVVYDVEETIRAYATPPFSPDDIATLAHVLRTGANLQRNVSAITYD